MEIGTQGRIRTGTAVKPADFESAASTIPPLGHAAIGLPFSFGAVQRQSAPSLYKYCTRQPQQEFR